MGACGRKSRRKRLKAAVLLSTIRGTHFCYSTRQKPTNRHLQLSSRPWSQTRVCVEASRAENLYNMQHNITSCTTFVLRVSSTEPPSLRSSRMTQEEQDATQEKKNICEGSTTVQYKQLFLPLPYVYHISVFTPCPSHLPAYDPVVLAPLLFLPLLRGSALPPPPSRVSSPPMLPGRPPCKQAPPTMPQENQVPISLGVHPVLVYSQTSRRTTRREIPKLTAACSLRFCLPPAGLFLFSS